MTSAGQRPADEGTVLNEQDTGLPRTSPTSLRFSTVLAAVNDASRRRWRWPAAIIDCGCARCHVALRSGRRNGPSQTKKLSLDFLAAIREPRIKSCAPARPSPSSSRVYIAASLPP